MVWKGREWTAGAEPGCSVYSKVHSRILEPESKWLRSHTSRKVTGKPHVDMFRF